jgi:hypothetical protein
MTQGGEDGLQVLVAYVPGGDHAISSGQVAVNAGGLPARAPLDASGAPGPFVVGGVVKIITSEQQRGHARDAADHHHRDAHLNPGGRRGFPSRTAPGLHAVTVMP